jgi:hypothetical protein
MMAIATRWQILEGIIQREMGSFMAVGKALQKIREQRLYREEFKTFAAYCREKWGVSKDHATRLITGSKVADNLMPRGILCTPCEIQPIHEQQVRPLAVLDPDQQCEVWEEAVRSADGKTATYKQVKALVEKIVGPAEPIPPKEKYPHPLVKSPPPL